ncbi:hypothetical protein D8674_010262 [Pyrus ussuriensis x Pyrus communis]|uniref:HAT C-terminal dimerisation domain-containing protein n=1 Tax=Pyrus ussuriensis x Pyrus communis TaxID=2448454 RepID=A0A5N5FDQ6_9ROSA|nr:hypothetical protein D8674_010262 [Pyrus ussuriensis x Pyrus communis]
MASSSRPSGASVPGGLDVAWKYALPIEGNKHGTICTFCESIFQSGGITQLKYHLAGFDPHKSVKKYHQILRMRFGRLGATWFATNYITINNILNKKARLRQLFTSEEWYNSRFSLDHRFWDAMEEVQSIYEPLYSILRIVDTETTSSSACERNWSTFALIHTKQRNHLAYTRLEKIVFCYYNMKLKLRDEEAEMNKVAENDYINLLDIARVISEDVRSGDTSSFERDMIGTRQGQRRPLRDDASTSKKENEDHGCREAGAGIGAIGKQYSGKRSQPINPSEDEMAISFGSMSIKTRPSTNSNESYDGYGYVMSDYNGTSYGAQDDETDYGPTSWVNPKYPMYGRIVGSSRKTYVHHVQTWLTNCSGYMTWYDYCMNLDGCSSLFEPHNSSSFM